MGDGLQPLPALLGSPHEDFMSEFQVLKLELFCLDGCLLARC